jgi:uncharacterized repeat protein (TIGR02543 family)
MTTNAPGPGVAITNLGILAVGDYNEFYSLDPSSADYPFPTLYQTSIDLQSRGLNTNLIASVTFTMPGSSNAGAASGIFALSGTQAPYAGNYPIAVTASPVGAGVVGGGGAFALGSTNTVTAAANAGYIFADWTQGGVVTSASANYTFIVNGSGTLVANFLPACTLAVNAAPANGGTVGGGGTFLQGSSQTVTATANGGFEFIGWTGDATGTTDPLTLTLNTNLTITANFASNGANITLTVVTNGDGTVSPNLNGKDLKANRNYTLTATARNGNVFSNWTGSLTTAKNPLIFKAESNMVLQANFIPNPFLSVKGTYNGLFFDQDNGVAEQTAGMLKGLAVGQKGTYSGTVLIDGASHGISGKFDLGGQATNYISRPAAKGGPLTLVMLLNWNAPPPQVTGTITGTNWMAELTADRATNSLPPAEYTMLIPPDTNSAPTNSPGGDGYALITNRVSGASITGALADGTAYNQTVPVSQDGYVPIYANLYGGKGLLLGWINLDLTNTDDVGLTWIHPQTHSGIYTGGFTNVLSASQILLSQWTNSPGNFDDLTNLSILDTDIPITVVSDKVSGTSVNGAVTPRTGLFTVTIGSGPARITGHGAILLNAGYGGGYFVTKTNAGAINLTP